MSTYRVDSYIIKMYLLANISKSNFSNFSNYYIIIIPLILSYPYIIIKANHKGRKINGYRETIKDVTE